MNAQIKLLSEQAIEYADYYAMLSGGKEQEIFTEKFAELIVRECLDIVNRKEYSYHEADPLWETSQLIKEHFGVE